MSKGKEREDENIYDRIRREAREKQEREAQRQQELDKQLARLGWGGFSRL